MNFCKAIQTIFLIKKYFGSFVIPYERLLFKDDCMQATAQVVLPAHLEILKVASGQVWGFVGSTYKTTD